MKRIINHVAFVPLTLGAIGTVIGIASNYWQSYTATQICIGFFIAAVLYTPLKGLYHKL